MNTTKVCSKCKKEKSLELYHRNKTRPDGRAAHCKECERAFNLTMRKTENKLLALAKYRAKKKNLEFNLELEDIKIPKLCPVLGIKLERNRGGKAACPSSPSIDRIDNDRGYVKGNIKIISYKANTLKSSSSTKDLQKVISYMEDSRETLLQKVKRVVRGFFKFLGV